MTGKRNRLTYSLILGIVIIAGLSSRSRFAVHLPVFLSTYAGDTLWTVALYLTICILFPGCRVGTVALISLVISFSVEFSQLYKAAWLNTIRSNRIGALILGSGFLWSDLPCYTVGCLVGVTGDLLASVTNRHVRVQSGNKRDAENR